MDVVEQLLNTVRRAGYRAMLGRFPEPAAHADSLSPLFGEEAEARAEEILRGISESEEFRGRREVARTRDYSTGTWVIAEIDDGLRLWVDLGDLGVSRNCVLREYEPIETAFLNSVVKPGMTFLDIGANVGWFTMRAARAVGPQGRVIAIEPRGTTSRYLAMSVKENGFSDRVTIHRVALGREAGEMLIGCSSDGANTGGTWSLTTDELVAAFDDDRSVTERVTVARLDELIGADKVDVIKIDIEGAELIALSGGESMIRKQKPVILSEISPSVMRQISSATPEEYVSYICSLGYRCFDINPSGIGSEISGKIAVPIGRDVMNVAFIKSDG